MRRSGGSLIVDALAPNHIAIMPPSCRPWMGATRLEAQSGLQLYLKSSELQLLLEEKGWSHGGSIESSWRCLRNGISKTEQGMDYLG